MKITNDVRSEVQGQTIDDGVHLDLAEDILKALFNDDMESASRIVWCVGMLLMIMT